jgi:hypothetical protein
MDKVDFKKLMKPYWQPSVGRFVIVDIPEFPFVMVDGAGDPNTAPAYASAVSWLFTVSYTLKFMSKSAGRDFGVAPLEGLWWSDDTMDFVAGRKDRWSWTMMIMQPDWLTPAQFDLAREKASVKLGQPPAESLRLQRFTEGLSVQTMYIGPYSDEGPTIRTLHEEFLPENGLAEAGKHHEIYLGDPRRIAPEKLKTIIRQPVRRT